MQPNLITRMRGMFSPAIAKSADVKPSVETAVLCMPAWSSSRSRHLVHLLSRQTEFAKVWSPEYVDVGETVWLEEEGKASRCNVQEYVAAGGGYRLTLTDTGASRRAKERLPCNTPGDLEWIDGLTRVKCPVRVTNVTPDGVQVTLLRPTPQIRSVRLQFKDRTEVGSVRYCVQIGASYLAGIEFV